LLENTEIKQKFVITKNVKVMNNFVELNNLTDVKIITTELNNLKSFARIENNDKLNDSYNTDNNSSSLLISSENIFRHSSAKSSDITSINPTLSNPQFSILCICDDNLSRIFIKRRIKRTLSENMDLLLQIKQ
jgi:hypothetical protein